MHEWTFFIRLESSGEQPFSRACANLGSNFAPAQYPPATAAASGCLATWLSALSLPEALLSVWLPALPTLPAAEEEERYIQHVVVRLHPTFRPNTLVLCRAPYAVRRLGWGIFVVTATVAFRQEWGGATLVLHWMLDFDGGLLPALYLPLLLLRQLLLICG